MSENTEDTNNPDGDTVTDVTAHAEVNTDRVSVTSFTMDNSEA